MSPTFTPPHLLASKILTRVFGFYVVGSLLLMAVLLGGFYYEARQRVQQDLGLLAEGVKPVLRDAVPVQIYTHLQNLLVQHSEITGALWEEAVTGQRLYVGQLDPTSAFQATVTMVPVGGQVTLYSGVFAIWPQLKLGLFFLLANMLGTLVLLWWVFGWVGKRYLTRPLRVLTHGLLNLQQGKGVPLEISTRIFNTELGEVFSGFNRMVSGLETTKAALYDTQERLRAILDSMPAMVISVTRGGLVKDWNKMAVLQSQLTFESVHNKPLITVYPQFLEFVHRLERAMKEGNIEKILHRRELEIGVERFDEIIIYPVHSASFQGAVIRIEDVSWRIHMENLVVQTEKMASIGTLAAGVAHEINNPLGAILQYAQNIQRRLDPVLPVNQQVACTCDIKLENLQQYLEAREIPSFVVGIRKAGERAALIVRNLLQFSRKPTLDYKAIAVPQWVNNVLQLLPQEPQFARVQIQTEYHEALPMVRGCLMELEQVLVNLFKNAAQAMAYTAEPLLQIRAYPEGMGVQLEIQDNGVGLPAAVQRHIFEPFFTTKPAGEGTGLGLSVCYGIVVKAHQGQMWVESKEGHGAKFVIWLPAQ